jgi:opacity protein-like surface antigen
MKKTLLTFLIISSCLTGFSQNSRLFLDINLPFPIGDNFIGKNYKGVFDLGFKFNMVKISKLKLGISNNVGLLNYPQVPVHALMIKPRLNAELGLKKITPYAGIGYSLFTYYYSPISPGIDKTNDGLNINFGLRYNLISIIYVKLDYDFIKFRTEKMVNTSYNRNIMILNAGIGIKL